MAVGEHEVVFVVLEVDRRRVAPWAGVAFGRAPEAHVGGIPVGDGAVGLQQSKYHLALGGQLLGVGGNGQCVACQCGGLHGKGRRNLLKGIAGSEIDTAQLIDIERGVALQVETQRHVVGLSTLVYIDVAFHAGAAESYLIGPLLVVALVIVPLMTVVGAWSGHYHEV